MLINQRRRLIVNREVQFDLLSFIGLSCSVFFVGQILLAAVFYSQIRDFIPHLSAEELISRYGVPFFVLQLIPLTLSFVISATYFNALTNKIVGPIYKIRKTFEEAAKSEEFHPIILRDGDYFQKEVEVINDYMRKKVD